MNRSVFPGAYRFRWSYTNKKGEVTVEYPEHIMDTKKELDEYLKETKIILENSGHTAVNVTKECLTKED